MTEDLRSTIYLIAFCVTGLVCDQAWSEVPDSKHAMDALLDLAIGIWMAGASFYYLWRWFKAVNYG